MAQAGKIETYGQGCDGPLRKVVRDFLIEGDYVSLIDEKAGIEHFGRRIPDRMDIILGVLDCTRESVSIARRVSGSAKTVRMENVWFVLNKTESENMAGQMTSLLDALAEKVIGQLRYDPELVSAALDGRPLDQHAASEQVEALVQRPERIASDRDRRQWGAAR